MYVDRYRGREGADGGWEGAGGWVGRWVGG